MRTNPYLRAFASSALSETMRADPNYKSWANINGKVLRKEIAEASAAAARVPAAIAKARDGDARGDGGRPRGRKNAPAATPTPTALDATARGDGDDAGDPLGDGAGVVIFDLCSGKGFTSLLLAHRYPKARVFMVDKCAKMNLKHLDSLAGRVSFSAADLYARDVEVLIRDALAEHGANGSCIVGVHLCGDLSRRAVELFIACGVDGLGAFYTLVPIRPRWRGERRSLRTLSRASLRPPIAFNARPRRLSTPSDAFELHPDVALCGTALRRLRSSRTSTSPASAKSR